MTTTRLATTTNRMVSQAELRRGVAAHTLDLQLSAPSPHLRPLVATMRNLPDSLKPPQTAGEQLQLAIPLRLPRRMRPLLPLSLESVKESATHGSPKRTRFLTSTSSPRALIVVRGSWRPKSWRSKCRCRRDRRRGVLCRATLVGERSVSSSGLILVYPSSSPYSRTAQGSKARRSASKEMSATPMDLGASSQRY